MTAKVSLTARGWPAVVFALVLSAAFVGVLLIITARLYHVRFQTPQASFEIAPSTPQQTEIAK